MPIPPFLVDALAVAAVGKTRDQLLFGNGITHLERPHAADGWVVRAVAVCRTIDPTFPVVTIHDLRHTAASLAVSAGANVKAVQRMLGHASAAMTLDTYADLFDDDLDAVSARLEDVRAHKLWGICGDSAPRSPENPGITRIHGVSGGGGWGIRTPEGFHPTRFPSVRHRPLGESSGAAARAEPQHPTGRPAPGHPARRRVARPSASYTGRRLPAWRHPGQLPQGGNAARATGLWRVRGGSFFFASPLLRRASLAGRPAARERPGSRSADRPAMTGRRSRGSQLRTRAGSGVPGVR